MSFKFTKSNLNFDVYTVNSKPTDPGANNDIAIITSVPMPNWIMSPDKPSGMPRSDGDVWIRYSVSGNTFNALKNNTMMIATISAWQYVDGAWTEVKAVSCQNGEWVNLWDGITLKPNDTCVNYTGGWVADGRLSPWKASARADTAPTVTNNTNNIVVTMPSTHKKGCYRTVDKVDVSYFNSLKIDVVSASASNGHIAFALIDKLDVAVYGNSAKVIGIADGGTSAAFSGTKTLDISTITGEYYIALAMCTYDQTAASTITLTKVYLE